MDTAQQRTTGSHNFMDVTHLFSQWELRREHRVYGTPGLTSTTSISDQHSLHALAFYTECVTFIVVWYFA